MMSNKNLNIKENLLCFLSLDKDNRINIFSIDDTTIKISNLNKDRLNKIIELVNCLNENDIDKFSDGDHSFDELYTHRAILFAAICNQNKVIAWKAKKHSDGTMFDDMFIAGINTPNGQASYHYYIDPFWDIFHVKELEYAPEWDGHDAKTGIERINELFNK